MEMGQLSACSNVNTAPCKAAMFGIAVLEMIPSVRCLTQTSMTSVHKLDIGPESAAKLSNHKLSQHVAWQLDLTQTIHGDRGHVAI